MPYISNIHQYIIEVPEIENLSYVYKVKTPLISKKWEKCLLLNTFICLGLCGRFNGAVVNFQRSLTWPSSRGRRGNSPLDKITTTESGVAEVCKYAWTGRPKVLLMSAFWNSKTIFSNQTTFVTRTWIMIIFNEMFKMFDKTIYCQISNIVDFT